jgi:uncharacterized membrane protein
MEKPTPKTSNWRSPTTPYSLTMILVLFSLCLAISVLTPPFQSPDEDMHLKRAYLLAHGQIWLETPAGKPTGGEINQGLLQYAESFEKIPFHAERKLSANELYEAGQVRWQNTTVFSPISGPNYYFPLIYTPQAIGIGLGEALDLSVHTSYQLAKFAAVLATCFLIYWALSLYQFSAASLALFILPMSLFQIGSASLDGIAHALSLVVIALFLKVSHEKEKAPIWITVVLPIVIALLATSRMHVLPLILFLFLAYRYTKNISYRWSGFGVLLFSLTWILASLRTVVDIRVRSSLAPSEILIFYLTHPIALVEVLWNTLSNPVILKSYATSFIGVLGWLDASLPKDQYIVLGGLLVLLFLSSITLRVNTLDRSAQWALLLCAFISMAIVMASLLISWTPHPAKTILGVQGRYFFIPVLLIAVAFTQGLEIRQLKPALRQTSSLLLLALLSFTSLAFTSQLLLQRYYFMAEQSTILSGPLSWSAPLSPKEPITVFLSPHQAERPALLRGLSIFVGAPNGTKDVRGKAELIMRTSSGSPVSIPFLYTAENPPAYIALTIPQGPYITGSLKAIEGGGLQVQEVKSVDGKAQTCLVYELSDGSRRYTPGCP